MDFQIYNCYRCPRCKFFEGIAFAYLLDERWRKRGWCKHFRQDVLQDPDRELKHPGKGCGI